MSMDTSTLVWSGVRICMEISPFDEVRRTSNDGPTLP